MNYQFLFNYFFKLGLLGFCFFVLEVFLLDIGETNPKPAFLNSIDNQEEIIIGQSISTDLRELKISAALTIDPEIITIGNSRMNNFRANMFAPYSFYNLSLLTTNYNDYRNIITRLDSAHNLKMVIVIIEPFGLRKVKGQKNKVIERKAKILNPTDRLIKMYRELKKNIFNINIQGDNYYGIKAHNLGRGFRSLDGSVHSGRHHLTTGDMQRKRFNSYLLRKDRWNKKDMFQHLNSDLNHEALSSFQCLIDYADTRGITIVGITPPFSNQVTNGLKADPETYKLWHILQTKKAINTLRSISGFYYNFSNLDSLNSSNNEMIDMIHPSEKICAKMLLKMLEDKEFRKLFPKIDDRKIKDRIESTKLPLSDIFSQP